LESAGQSVALAGFTDSAEGFVGHVERWEGASFDGVTPVAEDLLDFLGAGRRPIAGGETVKEFVVSLQCCEVDGCVVGVVPRVIGPGVVGGVHSRTSTSIRALSTIQAQIRR
jgi:hypothetical protein